MPLDSVAEQIARCIKAKLEGIVAGDGDDDAWYTPQAVARVSYFHVDWLNKGYETIYLLRAEDEMPGEVTSGSVMRVAEFYILGARQFSMPGTEPYNLDEPILQTVQNRLIRDVERLVWADVQLASCFASPGNPVENMRITDIDRTIVVTGWAVVQLRLEISYDTLRGRP